MNSKYYKCCTVSLCISTTIKTPEKLFISVPRKAGMRSKWLKLAGRDPSALSARSRMYFCEDHFDLPKDMENYMQYKVLGSVSQIKMKDGCLPSRFECQNIKRKVDDSDVLETLAMRRERLGSKEEGEMDIKEEWDLDINEDWNEVQPGPSSGFLQKNKYNLVTTDKSIQVCVRPKFRSKGTQITVPIRSIATSPIKCLTRSISTSPITLET